MGGIQSVGIYASANDITLVELTQSRSKCQVTQLVQQTIPPGAKLAGSSVLQQLTESFKIEAGIANFLSLASEAVVLRYFKMIKIPKKEWDMAVRFEARKYLPFNMEQMNSDFLVIPMGKGSDEMEVVFFAVDQSQTQEWFSFLQQLGFTLTIAESSWLSVLRLLQWNQQLKEKATHSGILLSIESDRLGIGLFADGIPYFSREVKWAGSIHDSHSPDLVESVAGEIRLAREFHRKNFPQSKELSAIYTFGAWDHPELNTQLTKECELNCVGVDPYLRLKGEKPAAISSGIVIGIGAALRGLLPEVPTLQIHLEGIKEKYRKKIPIKMILTVEAILAFLILVGIQLYSSAQIKNAHQLYQAVVQARPVVTSLKNPLQAIERLENIEKRYQEKLSLLSTLIGGRIDLTTKLSRLGNSLPDPMWLQKFYWRETFTEDPTRIDRELRITAMVLSEGQKDVELINTFSETLRKSDFFRGLLKAEVTEVEKSRLGVHAVSRFEWLASYKRAK